MTTIEEEGKTRSDLELIIKTDIRLLAVLEAKKLADAGQNVYVQLSKNPLTNVRYFHVYTDANHVEKPIEDYIQILGSDQAEEGSGW